jgi:hypothetical protein
MLPGSLLGGAVPGVAPLPAEPGAAGAPELGSELDAPHAAASDAINEMEIDVMRERVRGAGVMDRSPLGERAWKRSQNIRMIADRRNATSAFRARFARPAVRQQPDANAAIGLRRAPSLLHPCFGIDVDHRP